MYMYIDIYVYIYVCGIYTHIHTYVCIYISRAACCAALSSSSMRATVASRAACGAVPRTPPCVSWRVCVASRAYAVSSYVAR